jgi:hypothetical protein
MKQSEAFKRFYYNRIQTSKNIIGFKKI